ncbi:MAG: hypothetical protein N2Z20_04115 [Elusimicrobiales bacterium]|nr:hypothetical protein [Elusimicrobiales bacterium]
MKFLFIFIFSAFSLTIDEIQQKIIQDKFFRGIVADNLAENKEFVVEISCQRGTYSDMRLCIMEWIKENPQKASELFANKIKDTGGFKISSTIYEDYLNPYVKQIIDKMTEAARGNLNQESMRELSSLLFDANLEKYDFTVETSNSIEKMYNENFTSSNYYKINKKAISDEISAINNVYSILSGYKVKDILGIIKNCDEYYIYFSNYISTIKNVTMIDNYHLNKLNEILFNMKKKLILKSIVIRIRMEEQQNYKEVFSKVLSRLEYLNNVNLNFSDFIKEAHYLWSEIENLSRILNFISENEKIYQKLNRYYSCLIDYIFFILESKVLKLKFHKKVELDLLELKNYFNSISFNLLNTGSISVYENKRIVAINLILEIIKVSKINRKIQYILWESLLPFDIYFRNKKIYFGIKIAEEKLFYYSNSKSVWSWDD